jgi:hypothetical protein
MLGCGAILARNPRNFGGPIFTIEGMSLMNPWRGSKRGLMSVISILRSNREREERKGHISWFEASIYSLGGDVSDKVSKGTPIPAWPISSRETRDIQTSISSSVEESPACNRLTKVSSS